AYLFRSTTPTTTHTYTLSLHDALPIFSRQGQAMDFQLTEHQRRMVGAVRDLAQGEFKPNAPRYLDGTFPWENTKKLADIGVLGRSEEHTSELQSRGHLVCRLLLEKKNK